jgi:4-hydroxy-3-methylbut-2-enyl diphosphate reductase IspH
VVIPYSGIAPRDRKSWEEADHPITDLTSPHVRRAQVALGLLRMEGAQAVVIGRHDDPETQALAGTSAGTRIIQDTTDTARLSYAPAFGVVCQTTLSPRRASWLLQQLQMRYRDARVTFLNTAAPAMAAREQALEKLLDWCDAVVVVGQPGEATVEALGETALRKGKPAVIAATPVAFDQAALAGARRIVLTAGAFAQDAAIRAIHGAIKAGRT